MTARIEIFRPGTHRSVQGQTVSFSETDLGDIAGAYDPALHEAPIVVGHPAMNAPAYGWVSALAMERDRLVATPHQVDPAFAEMVAAGRFRKVSASFYGPQSPGNPTPGRHYLRHVGFLGATPPAVKGLRDASFTEDAEGLVTVEFADWQTASLASAVARLFRGIRDWLIEKDGLETADKVLPDYDVGALSDVAAAARAGSDYAEGAAAGEPAAGAALDQRAADLAAREAAVRAREEAARLRDVSFAEAEARRIGAEDAAFVGGLVSGGRLPANLAATAVAVFGAVSAVPGDVSFAEAGETRSGSPRDALRALFSQLPLPVIPGEIIRGEDDGVDFADGGEIAGAIRAEMTAAAARGDVIGPADALVRVRTRGGK